MDEAEIRNDPDAAAPPPAARPAPGGPPWSIVLLITFLLGGMIGGVTVYVLGWGYQQPASPQTSANASTRQEVVPAVTESTDQARTDSTPARDTEPARTDLTALEPVVESDTVEHQPPEPELIDTSPAGLRAVFGPAILSLTAFDQDGDARPTAPVAVVGSSLVLAPYSAIEGTVRAELRGADRMPIAVSGIVSHSPLSDLVLLSVDDTKLSPVLGISADPLEGRTGAVLLGACDDPAWREAKIDLQPGAIDQLSGGPRLALYRSSGLSGVAIDDTGRVLSLIPGRSGAGLAVHPAAAWLESPGRGVPLDAFSRSAGPGSPTTQLVRARKLLSQRRYDEAARLFLTITAAEPRLIPEVEDDLFQSAQEAARKSITVGNGYHAVQLLTDTLTRLPNAADLWAVRGRGLAMIDNILLAIESFQRAAELDPSRETSWMTEARGLFLDAVNRLHTQGQTNQALVLLLEQREAFPKDGRLRMMAGRLLMQQRRFVEAANLYSEAALQDVTVAGEARQEAERARDLAGAPGAIVVDFAPGSANIVVSVSINGQAAANLLINPSEEMTVLPAATAKAAGYSLPAAIKIPFFADPGADEVPTVQLRTVTVAGISTDRIQAVVVDGYAAPMADGVLGRTFLTRFRRVEDKSLGRLVLYPR